MGIHNVTELTSLSNSTVINLFEYENYSSSLGSDEMCIGMSLILDYKILSVDFTNFEKEELILIQRHIQKAIEEQE